MTPLHSLRWAVLLRPGAQATSNEDSYSTRPRRRPLRRRGGMGGPSRGEVACARRSRGDRGLHPGDGRRRQDRPWPFPFDPTVSLEANRLRAAFRIANHKIAAAIADSHDLRGMATTASAVLVGPRGASVAHVGDSRVYVLRKGQLDQITHDHSWVEEQVRAGALSPTAARQHPWRNVVTRALSGGEDPEVDVAEVSPQPGERYLLCSDGLFTVVPDSRIAQLLGQTDVSLEAICGGLVQAANEAGA